MTYNSKSDYFIENNYYMHYLFKMSNKIFLNVFRL